MIGRLLRDAGHQVFEMVSAIGATRVVSAEDVHVVIVDLMMPALTGDKLVALFRRNPRWKDLALVIVSDSPGDELESLYQSVGADAGISKRDIPQQLVPTVERLARRAR